MTHRRSLMAAAAATVLLTLVPHAAAQGWPVRPVRLIVPFPPGGGTDGLARVLVERLGEQLGQTVVIDNIGGAGGTIGSSAAAKAAPDGYTFLMATLGTHSIAPTLYPKLPYEPLRDFAPVSNFAYLTNYLVAGPSMKAGDLAGLLRQAKAEPGRITFASAGEGTPAHLAMELFRLRTGADVRHIPYKGGGPAINDLLGGHVDAIFGDPVSVLPHVASGRLRALAFAGPQRSTAQPQVPTTAEAGLPDFQVRAWHGVLAPAGIDPVIARKVADAVQAATRHPAVAAMLAKMGAEPGDETLAAFGALIQAERNKWGEVVARANVRINP